MLLLLISFIAGILTILAPCVLPLLPVIIGGSLGGKSKHKSRPYIIAGSLALSIIAFTLLLKVSTALVNLSPNVLNYASGGLIVALGLVSIFPELWEKFMIKVNWESAALRLFGTTQKQKGEYIGPILIGIALGPVFASCSPTYAFILASILPRSFLAGFIYLITYSVALVLALLAVALLGRKFIGKARWAIDTHSLFRRLIGILFVVIGVLIISGQEVRFETWVGNHLPFDETKIEQTLLAKQHKGIAAPSANRGDVLNVQPTPAPELEGLTNWINSPPLTLAQLQGKVVLVDFWTYSCVNCNRALPYVEKWYQTYQSKGLVVIGVHTPEFAFEHNPTNVQTAVAADKITYPVALDNDYDTWNAFQNNSWPADYLIDKSGNIRYVALGEGDYNKTEEAIQTLLGINAPLQTPTSNVPITSNQTPETYFGTNRDSGYNGSPGLTDGTHTFTPEPLNKLFQNFWTLSGSWNVASQNITSQSNTTLTFRVDAKDVYVVAGSTSGQSEPVGVGLPSDVSGQYGNDAPDGKVMIGEDRLYHIVSLHKFGSTVVTLTVPPGISLYTFTFGS